MRTINGDIKEMTTPDQKKEDQVVEGQIFTQTLTIDTDRTDPIIGSLQADFGLCEADFLRIKNGSPKTLLWAHSLLLTAFGLGLSILGKYIERIINKTNTQILPWEKYGFISAVSIAVILYVLGVFMPNEKKKVMKDIKNHFKNFPKTKHIVSK